MGYWDEANQRFVDWVDRSGVAHDHIHLLASTLPVLFGYTSKEQVESVTALVDEHMDQFQRFPTFLAAHIDQYTDAEIGDGGPYDLCAASRYWCWDGAYWTWKKNGKVLLGQLMRVAGQAAKEGYVMGERYDMNYVYYIDDKDWHGAAESVREVRMERRRMVSTEVLGWRWYSIFARLVVKVKSNILDRKGAWFALRWHGSPET